RDRQRQLPVQEQLGRTQEQESQNTCLTRDQSLRDISLHGSVLDENVGSVLSETQQYAHLMPDAYVEDVKAWWAGGVFGTTATQASVG
ncbi:hypothetical protein, partial [Roseomonas sp. SXEYE001]|uniref:hypothetical protein n=1 Tax=Roseomonas xinghualingensis TaxID=2986475 RepID=UPI0021F0E98A